MIWFFIKCLFIAFFAPIMLFMFVDIIATDFDGFLLLIVAAIFVAIAQIIDNKKAKKRTSTL